MQPTTILTLELDPTSQAHFESLRRQHYPPHLNRIPAHITLFHTLPPAPEVIPHLQSLHHAPFPMQVTGLRSLGRGVAFTLRSPEAQALHAALAALFAETLTSQDRQPFHPHIVVQNKSTPESAKLLKAHLESTFHPFPVTAIALRLWNYLGGPWHPAATVPFA